MHGLPGMEKENAYYRLTFTARSLTGVSLGVRDLGAPYRTLSTFSPATDGRWRDFSYDFRFSPHPQEIGLYVFLAGNGSLDLQKLKLVKLSKQDLIAEIKAKYPEAGSGNLVNVSAFPLGLQSGWSIDREYSDGDQVQVDSDAKIPGPSGCSALRINATVKGIRLYSAPFAVPWSFETHVLGVSVRGDWDGKLDRDGRQWPGMRATAAEALGGAGGSASNCPSSRSCSRRRTRCGWRGKGRCGWTGCRWNMRPRPRRMPRRSRWKFPWRCRPRMRQARGYSSPTSPRRSALRWWARCPGRCSGPGW